EPIEKAPDTGKVPLGNRLGGNQMDWKTSNQFTEHHSEGDQDDYASIYSLARLGRSGCIALQYSGHSSISATLHRPGRAERPDRRSYTSRRASTWSTISWSHQR